MSPPGSRQAGSYAAFLSDDYPERRKSVSLVPYLPLTYLHCNVSLHPQRSWMWLQMKKSAESFVAQSDLILFSMRQVFRTHCFLSL